MAGKKNGKWVVLVILAMVIGLAYIAVSYKRGIVQPSPAAEAVNH